jgi:hypothetical protein
MRLETVSYTRRKPEEQYGHSEITLTGSFEDGDNPDKVTQLMKHHAHKALGINDVLHIDSVKEVKEGGQIETTEGNTMDAANTDIDKSSKKKVSKTTKKKTSKKKTSKKAEKKDESKKEEAKTEEAPVITLEVIQEKAKQTCKKRGMEVHKKIMEELGVKKTKELTEEQLPEALKKYDKALGEK